MNVTILNENDIKNISTIKKEYNIFRVIKVKTKQQLDMVEFFNKDGVFRGFGKNYKIAYKKAKKALIKYYK